MTLIAIVTVANVASAAVFIALGATLVLQAGKRTLSLKADDLEHYKGERGRRGNKLPRGLQRIDEVIVNGSSDQTRDAEQ